MENHCCYANHMSGCARETYERLVQIGKLEPEWKIMKSLIAWDSETSGITRLKWLRENGWIIRLSDMVSGDIPADGWLVLTHEEYRLIFPDECAQSSGRKNEYPQ